MIQIDFSGKQWGWGVYGRGNGRFSPVHHLVFRYNSENLLTVPTTIPQREFPLKAKAIIFTDIDQISLAEIDVPQPEADELLLETVYSLISPGTELRCRAGKQEGAVFPFIPGYALVGRVVAGGADTTLKEGTLVFCGGSAKASMNLTWGGHVSHAVQAEQVVFPIPDGVDPLAASAAKVAAIAYRGVRLSQPKPHETVAVIGLGTIGALAARLHALSGARVVAVDLSSFRVGIARQDGIEAVVVKNSVSETLSHMLPDGADVVVDATGVMVVLPQSLAVAKAKPWDDAADLGARVVIQGSYPGEMSFAYDDAFMKELSFYFPRDVQPRDIRAVLDMMARGGLSVAGIISKVVLPEAASETYAELATPGAELLTVAFKWS